ncbi:hypothetical protein BD413DRAFT_582445 [Trametes elegans]|nr:hypothetical protein BD413DRAFT_582445 [Trametes elegans]
MLIGDVGHIYQGAFYRLFNAILPSDHPVNRLHGCPDGHEQSTYPQSLLVKQPNALSLGYICSKNVLVKELAIQATVYVPSTGTNVRYLNCTCLLMSLSGGNLIGPAASGQSPSR